MAGCLQGLAGGGSVLGVKADPIHPYVYLDMDTRIAR